MFAPLRFFRAFACAVVLAAIARAESLLPPERVPLDSLAAFRPTTANWRIAGGLAGHPRVDQTLTPIDGTGVLVCNATADARGQLLTTWEHGDLELDLDFLMLPGADSGIYLQGRYEVQMRDSWGKKEMTASDNGGIYQTWDESKPAGQQGSGGHAPLANASRAPGLWQHFHVEFEAPRFDAAGQKTKNARFVRVVLNGFTVQENAEVAGPTRGAAFKDEAPLGPLMIQGNNLLPGHAVRNLMVKRFGPERIGVTDVAYQFFPGEFKKIGDHADAKPASAGALEKISLTTIEKNGKFALVFTGSLTVPRAGDYAFSVESGDIVRLLIDGRAVITPLDRGGQAGVVTLTAGPHAFQLDHLHNGTGRPALELFAEGPGIALHALTAGDARPPAKPKPIAIEPKDRVVLQRSFVPFEPKKRLYAINVGTPAGVHYAYDFETGALLRAWRGGFLDAYEMWHERGENQLAKPTGPALTFNALPVVALIEFPATGGWPAQADAMQASHGYTLEADGQPVFLSTLSSLTIRDRIVPTTDGRGLARTLTLGGKIPDWSAWVLLAAADKITPQPDGRGWIIGDREWYLDWPADSAHRPIVRTAGGSQQLAVRLTKDTLEQPVAYNVVW